MPVLTVDYVTKDFREFEGFISPKVSRNKPFLHAGVDVTSTTKMLAVNTTVGNDRVKRNHKLCVDGTPSKSMQGLPGPPWDYLS